MTRKKISLTVTDASRRYIAVTRLLPDGRYTSICLHWLKPIRLYVKIVYKYGTSVSAISLFIALRKMILYEALAPSAISFFRVQ